MVWERGSGHEWSGERLMKSTSCYFVCEACEDIEVNTMFLVLCVHPLFAGHWEWCCMSCVRWNMHFRARCVCVPHVHAVPISWSPQRS